MKINIPFYVKMLMISTFSSITIPAFSDCPQNNYLCTDGKGSVIHLCNQTSNGPFACCDESPHPQKCPDSHPVGPFLAGSSDYSGHDLRHFLKIAENDSLDLSEYKGWLQESGVPLNKLLSDFKALDKDHDEQISLAEFMNFRQTKILYPPVSNRYSTRIIFFVAFFVVFFCGLATVVFMRKIKALE